MKIVRKIDRAFRGEVKPNILALELLRRSRDSLTRQRDRARVEQIAKQSARLGPNFARYTPGELLAHFRSRPAPHFFKAFDSDPTTLSRLQKGVFPVETRELLAQADRIVSDHAWPLLGFGEKHFGEQIDWHRDPLSGAKWPTDYHIDVQLHRSDGSDVRVLWEVNRQGHLITLCRAYVITAEENYGAEVLSQIGGWVAQNPFGRGANWTCAMEVALRAINLLGVFEILRHTKLMTAQHLHLFLTLFDQHGRYIRSNLEFSYLATSNHYLSDVTGLLWLGVMLPELQDAQQWREFGLRELLKEIDKQILSDGADFESSTGYHRFVLELIFYSFILCKNNGIEIESRYWAKLRQMFEYLRVILRPDGGAPLIGDSDSGQVFPIARRKADENAYLVALGAVALDDSQLRLESSGKVEELLWLFGETGLQKFDELRVATKVSSSVFPDAGSYILRDDDLYLLFNASGAGINGRGSHGHNDALSVDVSACGSAFVVDPGTYVYTADLTERHEFRSTAYHSTVQVDDLEQNTTERDHPFVIGNEARPRVLLWETGEDIDRVSAEHYGYERLTSPVTHRRTITFNKRDRWWLVEDEFVGDGPHDFAVRFHFNAGIEVSLGNSMGIAVETLKRARLLVVALSDITQPVLESRFTSLDYGSKTESVSICWRLSGHPKKLSWALIPVCPGEDQQERLRVSLGGD